MAIQVTIGDLTYQIPEVGERSWGQETTEALVALANASYLIRGGNIPLVSEADFGPTAGLKAIWFASRSGSEADAGVVRLSNLDAVSWRNAANDGNLDLLVDASDNLIFNGNQVVTDNNLPVTSVFGRTGDVVAESDDYTWAQIDKSVSDLADLTTKSHTSLTDIGTNTHAQIDSHIADVANPHSVTATQVGLGNVDNTSDADKPVSTATQAALDLKQNDVITTRGDVIIGDATGEAVRLGTGAAGQVLTTDGTDVSWEDSTGGLIDPMTTRGDIIIRDATNTSARLGIGANGQILKSDGTDISWGDSDASSGGKNYVLNPDGALDNSDISVTGGVSATRTTTVADLPEPSKGTGIEISITAGAADDYAEFDATNIDDADGGRIGSTVISYKTVSGYTSGDFKAQAYSVTNSRVISEYSIPAGSDTVPFDTAMTSEEDIRVRFVSTVTNSVGLVVSGVTIEPVSQTTAGVTGKWVVSDVDLTNATATTETKYHRINGQNLDVIIQYDGSLSVTSTIQVALPSGYSVDTSIVQDHQVLGEAYGFDSGTAFRVGEVIYKDSVIKLTNDGNSSEWSPTSPHTWASADKLSVKLSVPVAELANAHTPLLSDVQYESARLIAYGSSTSVGTALTDMAWTTIDRGSLTSSIEYVIPDNADYRISAQCDGLANVNVWRIELDTGGGYSAIGSGYSTAEGTGNVSFERTLSQGDKVKVVARVASGSDTVTNAHFSVVRISDYSARAAGLPVAGDGKLGVVEGDNDTVDLTGVGSFLTGTLTFSKRGDQIICRAENLTWASSGTPSSGPGVIPAEFRPTVNSFESTVSTFGSGNVILLQVFADGTFSAVSRDWSGGVVAATTTNDASISYLVD